MTTMKQRAAARRNIKKAIAANRRHGGKHKKSHRSARSSGGASSHGEAVGAAYLNASRGVRILSPVIDAGVDAVQSKSLATFTTDLKNKANVSTGVNVAVTLADAFVDKKMGQAGALSRYSITAWAPEVFALSKAALAARSGGVREVNEVYTRTVNGYSPAFASSRLADPDFVTYRVLKHGGQLARKVLAKAPGGKGLKKAIGALGVAV